MKNRSSEYRYAVGNVCQDPTEMTTASGKTFYIFDIGVHHGEDVTEFISVSSWSPAVRKGDFIKVDGPVRMRKKQDGSLKAGMYAMNLVMLKKAELNSTVNA